VSCCINGSLGAVFAIFMGGLLSQPGKLETGIDAQAAALGGLWSDFHNTPCDRQGRLLIGTLMARADGLRRTQPYGCGACIGLLVAYWVYTDGRKQRERGAQLRPGLWAVCTFLLLLVTLPIYFTLRATVWQDQIRGKQLRFARRAEQVESLGGAELPAGPETAEGTFSLPGNSGAALHSGRGIASVILCLVLIAFVLAGFFVVDWEDAPEGSATELVMGTLLLVAMVGWLIGATLAYAGLKQQDRRKLFAIAGVIGNMVALLGATALMIAGLFVT
jgi:hypothetical protein